MAIDTEAKRRSALLEGLLKPDGSIATVDRQQVVWLYSGIETTVTVLATLAAAVFSGNQSAEVSSGNSAAFVFGSNQSVEIKGR